MFGSWKVIGVLGVILALSVYINVRQVGATAALKSEAAAADTRYKENEGAYQRSIASKTATMDALHRDLKHREAMLADAQAEQEVWRTKFVAEVAEVRDAAAADDSCRSFTTARMCPRLYSLVRDPAAAAGESGGSRPDGEGVPAGGVHPEPKNGVLKGRFRWGPDGRVSWAAGGGGASVAVAGQTPEMVGGSLPRF